MESQLTHVEKMEVGDDVRDVHDRVPPFADYTGLKWQCVRILPDPRNDGTGADVWWLCYKPVVVSV